MGGATPEAGGRETIGEAMAAIPYEPLLPVEKRLIVGSLILGVVLLGVLSWAGSVLFPVAPPAAAARPAPPAR